MSIEQLERLNELRKQGALTEEEFQREKEKILNQPQQPDPSAGRYQAVPVGGSKPYWGMELNTYCMFMHLGQLAGLLIPLVGWILPILMWTTHKDRSEVVDAHGKNILNWMISVLIFSIIAGVLSVIIIGIPLLIAIWICDIVFIIIGGMRANDGIVWKYPYSLTIMK